MCSDLGKMQRCTPFGEHCGNATVRGSWVGCPITGKIMGSQATQWFFRCVQGLQMDVPYFFRLLGRSFVRSFIHSFIHFVNSVLIYLFTPLLLHSQHTHTHGCISYLIMSFVISHIMNIYIHNPFNSCQIISLKVPVLRSQWFDLCFRRSCSSLKASRCPSTCGHMQRPSVLGLTNSNSSLLMVGCKVERRRNPTKFWSSWCFQVLFFQFSTPFLPGGMIQFDYIIFF